MCGSSWKTILQHIYSRCNIYIYIYIYVYVRLLCNLWRSRRGQPDGQQPSWSRRRIIHDTSMNYHIYIFFFPFHITLEGNRCHLGITFGVTLFPRRFPQLQGQPEMSPSWWPWGAAQGPPRNPQGPTRDLQAHPWTPACDCVCVYSKRTIMYQMISSACSMVLFWSVASLQGKIECPTPDASEKTISNTKCDVRMYCRSVLEILNANCAFIIIFGLRNDFEVKTKVCKRVPRKPFQRHPLILKFCLAKVCSESCFLKRSWKTRL